MSKLLKVGGVTNSGIASGVLLSDDGVVQVNTPQKDFYFGSVLEPVPAGFVGARGIFGLKCRASKSTSVGTATANGIVHKKSGEIVMIDEDRNMCIYDQSLTLMKKIQLSVWDNLELVDGHGDDVLVFSDGDEGILHATLVSIYGDIKETKNLSPLEAFGFGISNQMLKTETGYIVSSLRSSVILELDKDLSEIGRNDVRASHPEIPAPWDNDAGVGSLFKLDENNYALTLFRADVIIVIGYADISNSRVVNVEGDIIESKVRFSMVSDQSIYFVGANSLMKAAVSDLSGESISVKTINANLAESDSYNMFTDQSGNILVLGQSELVKTNSSGDTEFRLKEINNNRFRSLLYLSDRLYVLTDDNFYLLSEDLQLKGYSLTE